MLMKPRFLLAKLHMDQLSQKITCHEVLEALKSLPDSSLETLESWTKQIAQRIKEKGTHEKLLTKHIFTWVAHAKVELNIKQMQDSYAIKMSKGDCYRDHRPVEDLIMSACTGLVTMDAQKETLSLVHKSVKEHLQKYEIIPNNADIEIGKTCLNFLINTCNAKIKSPLLQYAAKNWWYHLCSEQRNDDEEIGRLVMKFLTNSARLTDVFMAMNETNDNEVAQMTGWHAAVYFDLLPWSDRLQQSQVDINSQCADGQTALHWAVGYGRLEFLKTLIRKSANPNLSDINGDTPLHKALLGPAVNKEGIVQILINGQARLDIKNMKGMSPLESAIRYGPTSIAKIMIESQSDVNEEIFEDWTSLRLVFCYGLEICNVAKEEGLQANSEGWNQLQMAARDHARFLTKLLLKHGVDLNTPSTKDGWTPLVFTAMNGDLSKMRRLLTRYPNPASVHLRDGSGRTPLWWATKCQKAAAIELLVDYGAKVNEIYTDGSTPLYEAVKNKDSSTVQLLVNKGANVNVRLACGSTLLIEATKLEDRLTAWVLLNAGARPDDRDTNNRSALIHAIEKEDKALIWLLITKGYPLKKSIDNNTFMDVQNPLKVALRQNDYHTAWLLCDNGACPDSVVDAKGNTLLHWAVDRGDLEDVRFLVHHGASINVQADGGLTPIHYAVLRGREDILDLLASHAPEPASLDVIDSRGNTALTLATLKKNSAATQNLIRHGALCNITGVRGLTALHHAARLGFNEGILMLLDGGADPRAKDNEHFTAVHHAINGGKADSSLVKMLAMAGSELEARDRSGRTPLMLAAQLGRDELVACLLSAGVDTQAQDNGGYLVFHYAMNYPSIQKLLCGHTVWNK